MVHRSVHCRLNQETWMSSAVLYMSVSLDGFVAGPNERWEDNPLGDDGLRLRLVPGRRTEARSPGTLRIPSTGRSSTS
jgi:hypothetical protein